MKRNTKFKTPYNCHYRIQLQSDICDTPHFKELGFSSSIYLPNACSYRNRAIQLRRVKSSNSLPITMIPLMVSMMLQAAVNGQNCFGGYETFERNSLTDFTPGVIPSSVLLQASDQVITRDCISLCRQTSQCQSFALDYDRVRCTAYPANSAGRNLTRTASTSLYEKICMKGMTRHEFERICGERMWAFERVQSAYLDGYVEKEIHAGSKDECEKFCITEQTFICRSVDFDGRLCRLSKEDRRTQPQAFRHVPSSNRDYLENQCASSGPTSCLYDTKTDLAVLSMDQLQFALNPDDCQMHCDKTTTFNCRSYSIIANRCYLSGDDSISLGGANLLPRRPGGTYGEKKCVTELCNQGIFTYEKVTGHVLRSAVPTGVFPPVGHPGNSLGNTMWCREACDNAHLNCPSFTVNYQSMRCERLDRNTQGRIHDLVPRDGESYFEKICLRVPEIKSMCQDMYWAFERVIGHELAPVLYGKVINFVQNRRDCEEYCLQEKEFICRSALYSDDTTECKLSQDDRRTQSTNFYRNNNHKISYLENQCIRSHNTCPYVPTADAYPAYTDLVETLSLRKEMVASQESCEALCNENTRFMCRSYAFYSSNGQCFLSGDDMASGSQGAIKHHSGINYYERKCPKTPGTSPPGSHHTTPDQHTRPIDLTTPEKLDKPTTLSLPTSYTLNPETTLGHSASSETSETPLPVTVPVSHGGGTEQQTTPLHTTPMDSTPQHTTPRHTTPPHTTPIDRTPFEKSSRPTSSGSTRPYCLFHQYTFEKTFGYDIRFARRERSPMPPQMGVATACQDECLRRGDRCKAFAVEYSGPYHSCFFLDDAAGDNHHTLMGAPETAYFEKICLRERICGKLWTFERISGFHLNMNPTKEMSNVLLKTDCMDLCLGEKAFACRSIVFDFATNVCKMYTETRRSRPKAFIAAPAGSKVDYAENQCASEPSTCQYKDYAESFFPFVDRLTTATSLADCQRQCDFERLFSCRSVNYETRVHDCALSSENQITIEHTMRQLRSNGIIPRSGDTILQPRHKSLYSEKGNCEQVTVQCTHEDMLLVVNFDVPFYGRVYAKGNPMQCSVTGSGQTRLHFAIALGSRCGTRQEGLSNFVNEVVIQQHSVIMRDSDRTIRVMCSFEAIDQNVTLMSPIPGKHGINVGTRQGARTQMGRPSRTTVSNTVPPPSVVMRILDKTGVDARVVGLGDELTLRIELRDPSSAFAIFARNLYAKSSTGDSLFLIDSNGCPVDPAVFPPFQLHTMDHKTLYSTFRAFRFPTSGVVNFEVQIKFCQDRCVPVQCPGAHGLHSFGRRRRSATFFESVASAIKAFAGFNDYDDKGDTFLEVATDEFGVVHAVSGQAVGSVKRMDGSELQSLDQRSEESEESSSFKSLTQEENDEKEEILVDISNSSEVDNSSQDVKSRAGRVLDENTDMAPDSDTSNDGQDKSSEGRNNGNPEWHTVSSNSDGPSLSVVSGQDEPNSLSPNGYSQRSRPLSPTNSIPPSITIGSHNPHTDLSQNNYRQNYTHSPPYQAPHSGSFYGTGSHFYVATTPSGLSDNHYPKPTYYGPSYHHASYGHLIRPNHRGPTYGSNTNVPHPLTSGWYASNHLKDPYAYMNPAYGNTYATGSGNVIGNGHYGYNNSSSFYHHPLSYGNRYWPGVHYMPRTYSPLPHHYLEATPTTTTTTTSTTTTTTTPSPSLNSGDDSWTTTTMKPIRRSYNYWGNRSRPPIPRPLPRPPGWKSKFTGKLVQSANGSAGSNSSEDITEIPLSLAIMVGDDDANLLASGDKSQERLAYLMAQGRVQGLPLHKEHEDCNLGLAIVYTDLGVTFIHILVTVTCYMLVRKYRALDPNKFLSKNASHYRASSHVGGSGPGIITYSGGPVTYNPWSSSLKKSQSANTTNVVNTNPVPDERPSVPGRLVGSGMGTIRSGDNSNVFYGNPSIRSFTGGNGVVGSRTAFQTFRADNYLPPENSGALRGDLIYDDNRRSQSSSTHNLILSDEDEEELERGDENQREDYDLTISPEREDASPSLIYAINRQKVTHQQGMRRTMLVSTNVEDTNSSTRLPNGGHSSRSGTESSGWKGLFYHI